MSTCVVLSSLSSSKFLATWTPLEVKPSALPEIMLPLPILTSPSKYLNSISFCDLISPYCIRPSTVTLPFTSIVVFSVRTSISAVTPVSGSGASGEKNSGIRPPIPGPDPPRPPAFITMNTAASVVNTAARIFRSIIFYLSV
jgi:hypothetical protein